MSNDDIYTTASYLLYGPIMLATIVVGLFFNALSIYLLLYQKDSNHPNVVLNNVSPDVVLKKLVLHGHADLWRQRFQAVQKKKRPRIYVYLLWITWCDTILLLCALMNFALPTMLDNFAGFYAVLMPIWYMLCNSAFTASVWLMLRLVRDRYKLLCGRFAETVVAKSEDSRKAIHILLLCLSISSIGFSLPRYFELYVSYNPLHQNYSIEPSELIENRIYMVGYRIIGSLVFYSAIPYIFIFYTSFRIWIILKTAAKARKAMYVSTADTSVRTDSDRVIISLAIRFLVSRLLTTLIDVGESVLGSHEFFQSSLAVLGIHSSNFIVVFSSATTFFTLFLCSTKFRASISGLCHNCCKKTVVVKECKHHNSPEKGVHLM